MKIIIHRGTREIGGTCIEIKTKRARIIVDIGMPLVDFDGERFDFEQFKNLSGKELIKAGVLPDVKGLYSFRKREKRVDAVFLSHPHQMVLANISYFSIPT